MPDGLSQLALTLDHCKVRDCPEPVAGSSITGEGHVCKRHNAAEWGDALSRNPDPYYRRMAAALRKDAA